MSDGASFITMQSLAAAPCWVAWQTQNRDNGPTGKPTKVPYSPSGGKALADTPSTWGVRMAAETRAAVLPKPYGSGGVGLEFFAHPEGWSLGGVDLDSCRDPETGVLEPWAAAVVDTFATYAEVSPSGSGVKLFFAYTTADLPRMRGVMGDAKHGKAFKRAGGEHPPAIELHLTNRFFAVTDQRLDGSPVEFRHVDTGVLLDLLQVTGLEFAANGADKVQQMRANGGGRAASDHSRSAVALRRGKELRRAGASFDEMVAAMLADAVTADWTRDKGVPNGQRELRRIWEKAGTAGPVIRVTAGELHTNTSEAENALIASGLPIYQRGKDLVRPVTREVPASHGRMTLAAGWGELNVNSMVDMMCSVAEWERFDARASDWVRINPPTQVAHILLSREGRWHFPTVAGIITTPTLRPDGTLLTQAGYDPQTRLYHAADPALRLTPSVHVPTRAAAEDALKALERLLDGFPFATVTKGDDTPQEVAKAAALSGLITPVVRGAMSVAPLHAVNAHAPGSGKSYLVDIVSMIATGRPCPVITSSQDEAENEKRIAALLLAGYSLVSLDNVNGELGGDLLCQAIERSLIRIRPLGGSDIVEIDSCVSMFATGNNIRVRGDMVRRTLVVELDAQEERPELRTFVTDPVAVIAADRGKYVSACLVIVRAYIAAGSPGKLPTIASFEGWSNMVRSALVWLGCADPALSMEAARQDDPELGELSEVMNAWHAAFGPDTVTCRRAIDCAAERRQGTDEHGDPDPYAPSELRFPELSDALVRVAGVRGAIDPAKMGRWLLAKEGRIVEGRRFKRDGSTHGAARWRLEQPRK